MKKNYGVLILLALLVLGAFVYRVEGIVHNHSFWADEAEIAATSRDLIQGKVSLFTALQTPGVLYQPLHMILGAVSFLFFGSTEWAARLISALFGTLGVVAAYLLAEKLSTKSGGLLAAFLFAFSQINLTNSTQFKPYTALEALFIFDLYLLSKLNKKTPTVSIHIGILLTSIASSLLHPIGMLIWLPYMVYISTNASVFFKQKNLGYLLVTCIVLLLLVLQLRNIISSTIHFVFMYSLRANNIPYLRELLWRNYGFILLPALVGLIITYSRNRLLFIFTSILIAPLLFWWAFTSPTHNIRYIMPFFGVMFVYFGVFWGQVEHAIFPHKASFLCLLVAGMLFLGGYKIVRKPSIYYSPNADLYGDVQIADYKSVFEQLKSRFPDLQHTVIFNDLFGPQKWYLNIPVTAYFMKGIVKPEHHAVDQAMVYGSLRDLITQMKKYPKGLLIVEDWQSLLPEDIKQYAKKNLKLEYEVKSLPQAVGDPWPIQVYSWGMNTL